MGFEQMSLIERSNFFAYPISIAQPSARFQTVPLGSQIKQLGGIYTCLVLIPQLFLLFTLAFYKLMLPFKTLLNWTQMKVLNVFLTDELIKVH